MEHIVEDRISALTTRDRNKLAVYTDGYDGHCLRASSYFAKEMPDITEKLSFAENGTKFYKVTLNDGSIEYFSDSDPKFKEINNV